MSPINNIPPLTSATLSGPTQGLFSTNPEFTVSLNEPAGSGGLVVGFSSANGSDTFQATQGGANVTSITIPSGSQSGTFWLTLGGSTGSRNISITTSTTLSYPGSPISYNAMPTATAYTVSGASGGHQNAPVTWIITLTGGDFSGTITATPGGGVGQCQIYSPSVVTFVGDGTFSKTFTFTPLDADTIVFAFTNSGGLADPSPATYVSTALYMKDTFPGAAGTAIDGLSSDAIPGIPGGSSWVNANIGGTCNLVGSGSGMIYGVYPLGEGALYTTAAAMPSNVSNFVVGSLTGQVEIQFDLLRASSIAGSYAGVILMYDSDTSFIWLQFDEGGSRWAFNQKIGTGYNVVASSFGAGVPPVGTTWRFKVDLVRGNYQNNQYTAFYIWYSADRGTTWNQMANVYGTLLDSSTIPATIGCGVFFQNQSGSATTGLHIGNIVVQDIPPPAPNCHLSAAYVTSSGCSAGFEFKTDSGNALVTPSALNYLPTFWQNGSLISVGTFNSLPTFWVNGTSTRAVASFAAGVQISSTDVVTMSAPGSWMTCGLGNASEAVTDLTLTNCVGVSAFGSVPKTLKPGFNISLANVGPGAMPTLFANLRYRLTTPNAVTTIDGYPTAMTYSTAFSTFYDFADGGNPLDGTGNPGVPGYYAVGYDDNAYGTANQCDLTILVDARNGSGSPSTAEATVAQIHSCDNTGSPVGIGQFYLFQVTQTPGSPDANLPLGLRFSMPYFDGSKGTSNPSYNHPHITNLFILGPGDFTYTLGVPLSFDRTVAPYRFNSRFLSTVPYGCGVLRFMDSFLQDAGISNVTEPWEMRNITDFSWDNDNQRVNVGLTQIRGLYSSNSPYIYGDPSTFPVAGQTWTSGATLGTALGSVAAGSQGTLVLSSATAGSDPIFYGLLLTVGTGANQELCRVRGVAGDNQTITVERGSSTIPGSMTPGHSVGAAITISSRWSWPSGGSNPLSTFSGTNFGNAQVVEILTNGPHNIKAGQTHGLVGSYPTITFADTSVNTLLQKPWFPTGPQSIMTWFQGGSGATTIASGTTYTLTPSTQYLISYTPDYGGFPVEAIGRATATIPGCNTYICMPILCSDSYAYNVFQRLLATTAPGRKIYVELSDEIWSLDFNSVVGTQDELLSVYNGNPRFWWSTYRTLQLRTIGRTVFATAGRQNEIMATISVQNVIGVGASQLAIAQGIGVPVDAFAVAPYWNPENSALNIAAWNGCTSIPQMADLAVHDLVFNPNNQTINSASDHNNAIASYNAATGNNCVLIGYEGGSSTGAPDGCGGSVGLGVSSNPGVSSNGYGNVVVRWNHDIYYDPVWRIYEKDLYAWMQHWGYKDFAMYAHSFYTGYQTVWGVYHWAYQLPGKGDGSDGRFNNRTCLATPGQTHSKASTVNQDQLCVSVRGQANIEWMGQVNNIAPTSAALVGPRTGVVGVQSTVFTVTLNEDAQSGGVVVTPASTNGGDTFQATSGGSYISSVTIPAGSTSVTFWLTPGGTAGNRSISITTSPALTYSGSPITYSAEAAPTAATLSGPSSGIVGVQSTVFTVNLDQPASTGGGTVAPVSSGGLDTFQATSGGSNVSSVTIPAGSTSVTFYLTPGGTAGIRSARGAVGMQP